MLYRTIAVALLLAVGAAPAAADGDDKQRADELIFQAAELGKQGRYSEAIDKFKQADRLYPRALNDCNIGMIYRQQEQVAQAHFFVTRCTERWARHETRPLPEQIQSMRRSLQQRVREGDFAPVELVAEPGTSMTVSVIGPDEQFAPRVVWLPFGKHQVQATRPNHRPARLTLDITDHSKRIVPIQLLPEAKVAAQGPPAVPSTAPGALPPASAVNRPASSSGPGWVPWTLLGAGLSGLAAGGYYNAQARATFEEIDGTGADRSQWERERNLSYGFLAAGGAVTAVGTAWLLWAYLGEDAASPQGESATPQVGATATQQIQLVWVRWQM